MQLASKLYSLKLGDAVLQLSYHLVRLQPVDLVQSVQDGQLLLHGREVEAEVPLHPDTESFLLVIAFLYG